MSEVLLFGVVAAATAIAWLVFVWLSPRQLDE